jgi:hypothetical protein
MTGSLEPASGRLPNSTSDHMGNFTHGLAERQINPCR